MGLLHMQAVLYPDPGSMPRWGTSSRNRRLPGDRLCAESTSCPAGWSASAEARIAIDSTVYIYSYYDMFFPVLQHAELLVLLE